MIIILDNYDSFTYNLYQVVAQLDSSIRVFRNNKITVAEIAALKPHGIIISPGPGCPEDAGICIDVVKYFAETVPILGVCLGHQVITVAFGGIVKLTNKVIHGKDTVIFHHRHGIYQNMPLPFHAGRYHSLITERETLPDELMIEAETSDRIVMGVRHKKYDIYGVQFHPESILTPQGDLLLQNFIALCQRSQAIQPLQNIVNALC